MRKVGTPVSAAESARNRLGVAIRLHRPAAEIDQARRDLAEAVLADHIRAARDRVAAWPLFTEDQIARLELLLRGEPDGQGT
jgi:hypothetical protein